jgi:hypothetical protein
VRNAKPDEPDTNKLILQIFAGYDLFGYERVEGLLNAENFRAGDAKVESVYMVPILYSGETPPDGVFGKKFNSLPLVNKSGRLFNYNSVVSVTDLLFRIWSMRTSFRVRLQNPLHNHG